MVVSSSTFVSQDVDHERKSKRKQDQMVDESESELEDESSSEKLQDKSADGSSSKKLQDKSEEDESASDSDSLSNKQVEENTTGKQKLILDESTKKAKQGQMDETKVVSSNEEESSSNDMKKMTDGSSPSLNIQKVANKNRFQKKFSFQDEEKILQTMIKAGEKDGYQAFWRRVKDSMQLSHSANESQLYEKTRRLKAFYKKNLKSNTISKDDQEYMVYKLADELWGEDERAKIEAEPKDHQPQLAIVELASRVKKNKEKKLVKEVKEVAVDDDDDTEYKQKYNKLLMELANKSVDFPVAAAMEVVQVSKRSKLEKNWEDMGELCLKTYKKKTRLVLETLEEVKPSPSHSNA